MHPRARSAHVHLVIARAPCAASAGLIALALAFGACASPDASRRERSSANAHNASKAGEFDAVAMPRASDSPDSIGYFLGRVDERVRAWSNLKLDARDDEDMRKLRLIEQTLQFDTRKRIDELLAQLESGPPRNRTIAAVGLGFSGQPQAQPALLAALSDPDPDVVSNALLALGILGQPDTPTAEIGYQLRAHRDGWARNNAAFALQRIAAARTEGHKDPQLNASLREALTDEMAGVRAQCAATLGALADAEAVRPLSDLLYDPENLVVFAAARALSSIGSSVPPQKGPCARALVAAYGKSRPERRPELHRDLVRLSEANYGEDVEPWKDWAFRLP